MAHRPCRMTISDLYCCECGFHMTVPRSRGKQRNKGHLKKLYCVRCKREVNFHEVREKDFILENVI